MNLKSLIQAGLTDAQARAYLCLVERSPLTPPKLATLINETRSNTYKVLEQLEELKLVEKRDVGKKLHFWAGNPLALKTSIDKETASLNEKKRLLEASLPYLLEQFHKNNLQPGIRYLQGDDGLKEIYQDQLNEGQTVNFVYGNKAINHFSVEGIHEIRNKFPAAGIKRNGITPDKQVVEYPESNRMSIAESDAHMLLNRTWVKPEDYTAPVEWAVYGDKVSITSFDKEVMGLIIESPQIANSFRQLFKLMDDGLKRQPDYNELPKKLKFTAIPELAKNKS